MLGLALAAVVGRPREFAAASESASAGRPAASCAFDRSGGDGR